MDYVLDIAVNAVASDIVGRIISRTIDSFLGPSSSADDGARDVHRLHLKLLLDSIDSVVEEAKGREITNNLKLLAQLQALNDAMYRGRFALEFAELEDIVNKNAPVIVGDDDALDSDAVVTTGTGKRSLALCSTLKAAKRARLTITSLMIRGGSDCDGAISEKRLAAAVEELEALTRHCIRNFILLVQGYPRRQRSEVPRPVTTTLYMDQCVFGRHVEKERIVNFLLQPPAPQATGLSALAVIGAYGVGKATLVMHACDDERVRSHFARFEWFNDEDLAGVRHILEEPRFRAAGRSLLVFHYIEIVNDEDAATWAALPATSKLAEGSKLVFTCWKPTDIERIERIIGTVELVVLRPLQEEEYWYFFKAFAFAGVDLRDHPRMATVGRDICHHLERTFIDARVLGPLLRDNFNLKFWRRVLASAIVNRLGDIMDVLQDLLPITAGFNSIRMGPTQTPPELTLQDVLGTSSRTSSSASQNYGLAGDGTDKVAIHLFKGTLYMEGWFDITWFNRVE